MNYDKLIDPLTEIGASSLLVPIETPTINNPKSVTSSSHVVSWIIILLVLLWIAAEIYLAWNKAKQLQKTTFKLLEDIPELDTSKEKN